MESRIDIARWVVRNQEIAAPHYTGVHAAFVPR